MSGVLPCAGSTCGAPTTAPRSVNTRLRRNSVSAAGIGSASSWRRRRRSVAASPVLLALASVTATEKRAGQESHSMFLSVELIITRRKESERDETLFFFHCFLFFCHIPGSLLSCPVSFRHHHQQQRRNGFPCSSSALLTPPPSLLFLPPLPFFSFLLFFFLHPLFSSVLFQK